MQGLRLLADTIAVGRVLGGYVGALVQKVSGWFSGLWTGIANGAQGVIEPIVGAVNSKQRFVQGLITSFYNSLPQWLKDALGGVGGNIQAALDKVIKDVNNAKAQVQINVTRWWQPTAAAKQTSCAWWWRWW